ncbi:MAG: hypothetical protein R3Y07_09585 [Eubacteriales bacterium]
MTATVITSDGSRLALPVALEWELTYTAGVPCDSFLYRCPWKGSTDVALDRWVYFIAEHEGETVFTGVVDECIGQWGSSGATLEVNGRGMAARLLDNEGLGQDYMTATLQDILESYVYPFGVELGEGNTLPSVSPFQVSSGASAWSVLYEFCNYYGGVLPRFNKEGKLLLSAWESGQSLLVDDKVAVTGLRSCYRRCGVLSEVWVRDRVAQVVNKVEDSELLGQGICMRKVITMPARSNLQTMEYSGQFHLDQAKGEGYRLELTLVGLHFLEPGQLVEISRSDWWDNGVYRLVEAEVSLSERGGVTRLELARRDVVL